MNPSRPATRTDASAPPAPWWRVGMVWLVVGGPLAVVVASFITLAIAVSGAEEVLTHPTRAVSADDAALMPAVQGRNHAATPKH